MVVVVFAATRKPLSNESGIAEDKYPPYFFMSIGMALGITSGVLLGLVVRSVSGGIAIGIGFGLIAGQFLERRHKGNIPQLTEQEKRERLNRAGLGLIAVIVLVAATLVTAILQFFR